MSIWVLIVAAMVAWGVVSAAVGLWVERVLRERRRGGTLEVPPFVHGGTLAKGIVTSSAGAPGQARLVERIRPYIGDEDQSAA